jgi:hypothetical protein
MLRMLDVCLLLVSALNSRLTLRRLGLQSTRSKRNTAVMTTDEVVPAYADAQERTNEIARDLDEFAGTAEHLAEVAERITAKIAKSIEVEDWRTLGHKSVSEWAQVQFHDAFARIDAAQQKVIALQLTTEGVSTRAIADVVGKGQSTVSRWQREGDPDGSPDIIHGRDGKPYPARREPSQAERAHKARRAEANSVASAMNTLMSRIDDQQKRSEVLDTWDAWGGPITTADLSMHGVEELITDNMHALVEEWETKHSAVSVQK